MDRLKSVLTGVFQFAVYWIVVWCIPVLVGALFTCLAGPFVGMIAVFVTMYVCIRFIS